MSRVTPSTHHIAICRGRGLVVVDHLQKLSIAYDGLCHTCKLSLSIVPELDADEELRHDDEDEDPGLPPQLGAVGVIKQLERLPQT